jgi:ferredoxin, 2Fe-2S
MPLVQFQRDGLETSKIDIPIGRSVMQGATTAGLDGIVGECGGELVCATCHVYVLSHTGSLAQISDLENEMLDFTAEARQANSRLSCQIKMTEELNGLVLVLPKAQV